MGMSTMFSLVGLIERYCLGNEDNWNIILVVSAQNYLNAIPHVDTLLVDMLALDFDAQKTADGRDSARFRIVSSSGQPLLGSNYQSSSSVVVGVICLSLSTVLLWIN